MIRRPKLLFLSQALPYPPDGGVKIRTYHVLRLLAREFDVTALCFHRLRHGWSPDAVPTAVEALGAFARVEAFPIPQEHSRLRLLWDHFRSGVGGRVYTNYVYDSSRFRARLLRWLEAVRFDLVHADSLDLSGYFPLLEARGLPVVCVHHDAQSKLLGRRAGHERGWRRAYVRHQSRLMAREERFWCPRVALNVAVSDLDREVLASIAPGGRFTVIPNGVDVEAFRPEPGRDEGLVFVGGTSWFPNRDAIHYFCREILPHIRREQPTAPVWCVGRSTPEERRGFAAEYGVTLTGYVPDVRPYVRDAGCFVVPIRVGGGTRIKILDAWAMGKAVVSTSIGCEGLAAVDGENILVRDTPEAFARAVVDVLTRPALRHRLGEAGRATVERRYSWDAIGRKMHSIYRGVAESHAAPQDRGSTRRVSQRPRGRADVSP
ncbi:MAG TPA: glycosyltransferase family 4 protein [Gemmatimonadales bacterium]|nr:glycosyltransferase family 4 protein [Gemmatimonadales bacterium]